MEPAERDDAHGPAMRPTSDYDGITLYEWMWSPDGLGLPLTSPDLMVYSKVYAVSHHNAGAMTASQPKLAQLFGLSRETVNRTLRRLVESGLVYVCGTIRSKGQGGRAVNVYAVCQSPIDRAVTGCRSLAESDQIAETGSGNVTESHISPSKRDGESPSNVTHEANVTEEHVRENGTSTGQMQSFRQAPLITKSNPNPSGGGKMRRELTETEFLAFKRLLAKSLRPVPERYVDEARGLFASCIDEGIGPELLLGAYGNYARQLIASRNSGGPYHPMSLTHFLMRNRGTKEEPRHNSWIEDEVSRSRAEADASGRGLRLYRDRATGLWIAFPKGGEPMYVPGIDADADEDQARRAWEELSARGQEARR